MNDSTPEPARGKGPGHQSVLLGAYLLLLCGALALIAWQKQLWYDELFSWYVARQDGPGGVLRALLAGADNGLPVDYLLRHFSMAVLGANELTFRLPSILAYALGLLCLWEFTRRRLSPAAAWVAVLLPLATASLYYATEGRAYALLLLTQSLSLLAWQRTAEARVGRPWPVVLFLSLSVAALTHYFGLLNFLPVMAGEFLRSIRQRKISKSTVIPIGLALLTFAALPPFARNALEMKAAFWASAYGIWTPLHSYQWLLGKIFAPMILLMVAGSWLWWATSRGRHSEREGFRLHELAAIAFLVLSPFVVLIMAILFTNAITPRYAIVSCFGFALLAAEFVHMIGCWRPTVARGIVLALLLFSSVQLMRSVTSNSESDDSATLEGLLAGVELPVVVDSPRRYMQSYYYLPGPLAGKLIYLTDREESRRRLGFDNDEIAIANLKDWVSVNTEAYEEFVLREGEFLVLVDESPAWLLARLQDGGASLSSVSRVGEFELYHVRTDPHSAGIVD